MTEPMFPINQLDLRQLQAIYELHMAPPRPTSGMDTDEVRARNRGPRDDLRLRPLNVEGGRQRVSFSEETRSFFNGF